MGLEAHLNKESVLDVEKNFSKKSYEYKRGPQAKTVIKQMQQKELSTTKVNFSRQSVQSENVYPKTLQALWQKITLSNSIYEPIVMHGFDCQRKIGCTCTPVPKEIRIRNSERKPEKEAD